MLRLDYERMLRLGLGDDDAPAFLLHHLAYSKVVTYITGTHIHKLWCSISLCSIIETLCGVHVILVPELMWLFGCADFFSGPR
jgi:hypothetical protein